MSLKNKRFYREDLRANFIRYLGFLRYLKLSQPDPKSFKSLECMNRPPFYTALYNNTRNTGYTKHEVAVSELNCRWCVKC